MRSLFVLVIVLVPVLDNAVIFEDDDEKEDDVADALPVQDLPNIPLTAFQRVRPGLGGPARATRTGTLARFKMLRVKSPMM
jgi:hypothetical protein